MGHRNKIEVTGIAFGNWHKQISGGNLKENNIVALQFTRITCLVLNSTCQLIHFAITSSLAS